jgi:SAM-dependent methyltransferase
MTRILCGGCRQVTRFPIQRTIERAWREISVIEEAFERGEIDQQGWHARMASLVVPAYLSGDNPRAQSGYSGTEADWEQARSLVAEAIPRSGTFLDVGCASGLLMENVRTWCALRSLDVQPYGLEIAAELAALARRRLPSWSDRVFEGNAAFWVAPFRFDFVRTGPDYVPSSKRRALFAHLCSAVLRPGGRLLIGPYTEERDETRSTASLEDTLKGWDFEVTGRIERHHPRDERVVRRLIFMDVL